jgi:PKD repeat protein
VLKYSKTSQCYPSNEIFSFSVINSGGAPANAIYTWDFGDKHTLNGSTDVRNIYDVSGSYTVLLTITDASNNLLSKTTFSISAWGQQVTPHAAFSSQIYDVNFVNNMAFTSSSSVQRGTITNLFWDWADGTNTSTPNAYTPHNFPFVAADKVYPVKLVATANSGCKDTATVNVAVAATYALSGDFNAVGYNTCSAEYFVLTPNVAGAPAGCVYSWDFADATGLATGNPVTHSFTYQNTYDVKMTVYLNGKNIYQTHRSVYAFGQNVKPKALFLKNIVADYPTNIIWGFNSQSNIAHGYLTGYAWDFGDGRTDNNFNPYDTVVYNKTNAAVNRTVRLIVTGNTGCTDTAYGYITIPAQ